MVGHIQDALMEGLLGRKLGKDYDFTSLYQSTINKYRLPFPMAAVTDRKNASLVDKVPLPEDLRRKDIHVDVQLAAECMDTGNGSHDMVQFALVSATKSKVSRSLEYM